MIFKNLLLIFLFLAAPAHGMNLTISPENPYVGDDITLIGDAAPNQILRPAVTFEKSAGVYNGIFDYNLPGIKIPSGENNFVVSARNVKDLYVGVVFLFTWSKGPVTADANGNASISQSNVPSGTYNVVVYGNAANGAISVPLTITASTRINADAQGKFSYTYSTSGIPAGNFNLAIGGITRTINLREKPQQSAGSSGGSPVITQTLPKPIITPTEVIVNDNQIINETPIPGTTSFPVETIVPTSTPTPTITVTESNTTPGFETGFAFGVLIVLCIMKRRL